MDKVIMSDTVVMNGPEATAGSTFTLVINKGINEPKNVEIVNAINTDDAVTVA